MRTGTVVAACRDPSSAGHLHALQAVADNKARLDILKMDIEDQSSVESAADHTKHKYGVSALPLCQAIIHTK